MVMVRLRPIKNKFESARINHYRIDVDLLTSQKNRPISSRLKIRYRYIHSIPQVSSISF